MTIPLAHQITVYQALFIATGESPFEKGLPPDPPPENF